MERELKSNVNPDHEIVMLFGYICSGKTTVAKQQYGDYHYIKVSDVVKSLTNHTTRSELQGTKGLAPQIAKMLIKAIKPHSKVVLDGIRQSTIISKIVEAFPDSMIKAIWLDTPLEVCRDRFKHRHDFKDDIQFDQAIKQDNMLGLVQIKRDYFKDLDL